MLTYLKSSLWDFLLCTIVSLALSYTLFSGFYATQPYQAFPAILGIAGVCALLTACLFLVSLSMKSKLIGGPVLAIALCAVIVWSYTASVADTALDDVEGNTLYVALLTIVPCVVVYILSRWRLSTVILLVGVVFVCALEEYLYWYGHYGAFAVCVIGVAGLLAYRTYQRSLVNSESEHLAFGSVTASGIALALVAATFGVGVFALVIAPLDPPNLVLKLFIQEYRAEEREVRGIATTEDEPDENLFSTIMGNQIVYSSDINDELYSKMDDEQTARGNTSVVQVRNSSLSLGSMDDEEGSQNALSMDWLNRLLMIVGILLAALIVGSYVVKKLLRRRRYRKLTEGSNEKAVQELYLFFLSRFKKLKIPLPGAMTLGEYAKSHASTFSRFGQREGTPSFADLTEIYSRGVFGGTSVNDDELGLFRDYYRLFYKNACRYVGRLKYCLLYFRV